MRGLGAGALRRRQGESLRFLQSPRTASTEPRCWSSSTRCGRGANIDPWGPGVIFPVVTSYWAPCQGHCKQLSSATFPSPSDASRCRHRFDPANGWPGCLTHCEGPAASVDLLNASLSELFNSHQLRVVSHCASPTFKPVSWTFGALGGGRCGYLTGFPVIHWRRGPSTAGLAQAG